jgi:hypothetical protein
VISELSHTRQNSSLPGHFDSTPLNPYRNGDTA